MAKNVPPAPVGHLFPPPKPADVLPAGQGPPRSDQIRATKSMSEMPQAVSSTGNSLFSKFKRKKEDAPPMPPVDKSMISRPVAAKNEPNVIIAGGGGIVPGTDAPVSAVNAGDRRVLVECGRSRNIFPVTPTTTPVDLIKSAATVMSEKIEVKSAVLLEYFSTVGVQRPLRRYEHVRDVMNSWDHDRQNVLILIDPGIGTSEAELGIAGAPKARPEGANWPLYMSSKPGKWDKRIVTLKPDGQITCQKEAEKAKDIANVCHISDFDIYTPTVEKSRKKIKPPKRYCFAIKSQQKTSMFESTQDFVHFFSTADKITADSFERAVQSWRSWYLVNVLGEGKPAPVAVVPIAQAGLGRSTTRRRSASKDPVHSHRRNESTASHYQLGSFMPLFDMNQFDKNAEPVRPAQTAPQASSTFQNCATRPIGSANIDRKTGTVRAKHPPVTIQNKAVLRDDEPLANLTRHNSVGRNNRSSFDQNRRESLEFSADGLLGRQYSLRQKDNADRAEQQPQPFTNGPNLLNGGVGVGIAADGIRRQTSVRNTSGELRRSSSVRDQNGAFRPREGSVDLHRTNSRSREPPRPLIDLTPTYREPPQHARKGKGFVPDTSQSGALIDNATSPEDPLGVPPSTDWRQRNRSASQGAHQQPSAALIASLANAPPVPPAPTASDTVLAGHTRSRSVRRPTVTAASAPFTGEGLLAGAQAQQGWGESARGRGVMDGSHTNGRPMIDLSAGSAFVQGSLLGKVENQQGGVVASLLGPVDREKRVERVERVGEGF
jgi:hypothetical protein